MAHPAKSARQHIKNVRKMDRIIFLFIILSFETLFLKLFL
jgi:hypothetical protein